MLTKVLRDHLRPYRGYLTAVAVLQLIGTIASLYLPSLNADIIDNGVAKGDTAYIWRVSLFMLVASGGAGHLRRSAAVRNGGAGGDGHRAATSAPSCSGGSWVQRPRGEPLRRPVADHPDHQRRPAGPAARR
jgi:hypothetical protein